MSGSHHPVAFKGSPLTLVGREIKVGSSVPDFTLTGNDMGDVTINNFKNKAVLITAVPSLDTPVCAIETKRFNDEVGKLGDKAVLLTVSMDLPFAQKRWVSSECATSKNLVTASDYKYRGFGEAFGSLLKEWGLLARAVFVVDKTGKFTYVEYVPEVSAEPNYEAALEALKKAV